MFAAELTFKRKPKSDTKQCSNLLWSLFATLRNNGQILDKYFFAWNLKDCRGFVQLPERASLNHRNDNKYVTSVYTKLAEAGLKKPVVKIAGETPTGNLCRCNQSSYYVLSTTYQSDSSPVHCGDCFRSVPLYWLPPTYIHGYDDLLRWKRDFECCDALHARDKTGVRFSAREMSDVKSSLSARGRELCQRIERLTRKPFYYDLFRSNNGRSLASEQKRLCPGCQQSWLLAEPLPGQFYYRCEPCRLVSVMGIYVVRGGER